jgi:hypothetical protein
MVFVSKFDEETEEDVMVDDVEEAADEDAEEEGDLD